MTTAGKNSKPAAPTSASSNDLDQDGVRDSHGSAAESGHRNESCQCGASLIGDEDPGPGDDQVPRATRSEVVDAPSAADLEELALAGKLEVLNTGADDMPSRSAPAELSSTAATSDHLPFRSKPAQTHEQSGAAQDRDVAAAASDTARSAGQTTCNSTDEDREEVHFSRTEVDKGSQAPTLQWQAPGPDRVLLGAALVLLTVLGVASRTCK